MPRIYTWLSGWLSSYRLLTNDVLAIRGCCGEKCASTRRLLCLNTLCECLRAIRRVYPHQPGRLSSNRRKDRDRIFQNSAEREFCCSGCFKPSCLSRSVEGPTSGDLGQRIPLLLRTRFLELS